MILVVRISDKGGKLLIKRNFSAALVWIFPVNVVLLTTINIFLKHESFWHSNSDKGPMLETSALETHYGGQFTSSTLVTRQNYFGCICCDSMLSLVQMRAPLLGLAKSIYYFLLFLGIVMYDNEFETKENKIWTKDKIELQHICTYHLFITYTLILQLILINYYWLIKNF